MAILGTVVALNGEASVIDEKGIKKPLHLGDVVQPGDTIITARGVVVELEMVNGRKIQVVSEQTVKFTQELADAIPPDSGDSSVDEATIQAVIKAIADGKDLSEVLEETAAGLGAGGGNSYGFSFVDLLRITEGVTPLGFEFDSTGRNVIDIENPVFQQTTNTAGTGPGNNAPVAQNVAIADIEGAPAFSGNLPATDLDGDVLTYTPIGALPPGLTINPDGSFTFDYSDPAYDSIPAGTTLPPISVPFTVSDGKGGTDTATLTITITGTNDDPVATATVVTGQEDAPFIPVTLTGTDVDGTVDFVTVTTLPPASQGVLYLADGVTPVVAGVPLTPAQATGLHFVPAPDFNGNVTIPFTVTDNLGAVSTPSSATITVNPVLDTTTVSLSATPSVAEGGSIVYTATLTSAAGSPVTVNLTGGQAITIA
ncbi:MAG TPA: retention module-containing protein, partial [Methylophilaceae bacterium]|nr:retention module-containing protein [Methylophilaceae bacterium]